MSFFFPTQPQLYPINRPHSFYVIFHDSSYFLRIHSVPGTKTWGIPLLFPSYFSVLYTATIYLSAVGRKTNTLPRFSWFRLDLVCTIHPRFSCELVLHKIVHHSTKKGVFFNPSTYIALYEKTLIFRYKIDVLCFVGEFLLAKVANVDLNPFIIGTAPEVQKTLVEKFENFSRFMKKVILRGSSQK